MTVALLLPGSGSKSQAQPPGLSLERGPEERLLPAQATVQSQRGHRLRGLPCWALEEAERLAEVEEGVITRTGPPPPHCWGPGVNRDWCSSPRGVPGSHQRPTGGHCEERALWLQRCAQGWAQPHGGGDRADSAGICLIAGATAPSPANKQLRAACSAAEQLLPMNTQVAAAGRAPSLPQMGLQG